MKLESEARVGLVMKHEHRRDPSVSLPTMDFGRFGVHTHVCACGAQQQSDPFTGEWGEWTEAVVVLGPDKTTEEESAEQ